MNEINVQRPSSRFSGDGSYFTSLEDIPNFRGTRTTAIFDNHVFWKRTLNAYGKDYHLFCKEKEELEQGKRLKRIKSAPMPLNKDFIDDNNNREKNDSGDDSMRHTRSQSAFGFSGQENRASRLRQEYLQALRAMNVHSVLTKFDDYRPDVRPHRPSNSARYPRKIPVTKSWADPEWDHSEYVVYVFHSRVDEKWVESWIKNVLESKRYNVKINSRRDDLQRFINDEDSLSRLIFILTPDLIRRNLKNLPLDGLKKDLRKSSSILIIKIRDCHTPEALNFTNYMDLSFCKMDDLTLQCRLLPKLISTLQLPKSVCS